MNGLKFIVCFMLVFAFGPLSHLAIQRGLDPAEMDSLGLIYFYGAIEASIATFILWFIMKIVKFGKK